MALLNKKPLALFRDILIAITHSFLMLPVFFFFMGLNGIPFLRQLLVFFILSQLLALVLYKGWLYLPAQFFYSIYTLRTLFPGADPRATFREWTQFAYTEFSNQLTDLLSAQLIEVPGLLIFGTLFVLITVLTYLTLHKKLTLPSFLTAFIYLMLVHTFSDNPVLPYIVQFVATGFLFISFMRIQVENSWLHFIKNVLLTSLVTAALTFFSYWGIDGLRSGQVWVEEQFYPYQRVLDSKGFFNWINTYSVGVGYQRTGFGLDDSHLGGPLHQNFLPVFRAQVEEPQYWKVLHRTEYTGTGWADNNIDVPHTVTGPTNYDWMYPAHNLNGEAINDSEQFPELTIHWSEPIDYLVYPYGWYQLLIEEESDSSIYVHERSQYYKFNQENLDIKDYAVTYYNQFPSSFDEEKLKQDDGWRKEYIDMYQETEDESSEGQADIITQLFRQELQLPESLPQRVIDLAEEITKDMEDEYDLVRAIENYLKEEEGYRYSLLEVENTPEGGDYVDHFLFESFIGYCDNFSSAMTILLRAVGIPARWVKGFSPGDYHNDETTAPFYQINNSHAHSWVEVYFPSYGWVPFEPSPYFANPLTHPEPVTSSMQESYSYDDEDFIDREEREEESETINEEDNFTDIEDENKTLLIGNAQLTPLVALTEDKAEQLSWVRLINSTVLIIFLIILSILFIRSKLIYKLIKWSLLKITYSDKNAILFILKLFSFKKKRETGQTIASYINQWKPFLSQDTQILEQFIALANQSFYRSSDSKEAMSTNEKEIIIKMLDLYKKAPSLKTSKYNRY